MRQRGTPASVVRAPRADAVGCRRCTAVAPSMAEKPALMASTA